MAHNSAKMTYTLVENLFGNRFSASGYEESTCRTVTCNGSKPPLEVMPGNSEKAGAEQLAGSRHQEDETSGITPGSSRYIDKQAYKTNPDWSAE